MINNKALLETEMCVIGAVLLDNKKTLPQIADSLNPTHFYSWWLGGVYAEMLKMAYNNEPIDFITLNNRLLKAGYNEDEIKKQLTLCMEVCPTIYHIKEHSNIIVENSKSRRLTDIAREIVAGVEENGDITAIIATASEKIAALAVDRGSKRLESIGDIIVGEINGLFDKERLKLRIDFGIANIDRVLNGIRKPDLAIVGARPGVGKTAFIMQVIKNIARKGKNVAFYNLEMGKAQIIERYLSNASGVDLKKIKNIECDDGEAVKVMRSCDDLFKLPITINDRASITVADIKNECRFVKNLDLIIIDYLQLIQPDTTQRYINRADAVGQISRSLKIMAKELNVPVIALSQLNRVNDETKEPTIGDLRESGSIEQDADVVMLMWKYDESNNIIGCKICKNRNGTTGKAALSFDGAHMKFLQSSVDLNEKKKKRYDWDDD